MSVLDIATILGIYALFAGFFWILFDKISLKIGSWWLNEQPVPISKTLARANAMIGITIIAPANTFFSYVLFF
jgi:hypothetical protein